MLLTLGLLMLFQGFRVATLGFLDEFIMQCTSFGNSSTILFLIGVIYWSFDKKLGEYLLVSFSFARIVDTFAKLTACIYRPWVLNPKIIPYEGALEAATGILFQAATHYHQPYSGIIYKRKSHKKTENHMYPIHYNNWVIPMLSGSTFRV